MFFDNHSLDRLAGHAASASPALVDACDAHVSLTLPLSASEVGLLSGETHSAVGSVEDIIAAAAVSPSLPLSLSSAAAVNMPRPTPIGTTLTFNGVPLRCLTLPERFLSILEGSPAASCSPQGMGGRGDRSEDSDSSAHSRDNHMNNNNNNSNPGHDNSTNNKHRNNNNDSSADSPALNDEGTFQPRSLEEQHCVVLRRAGTSTSKSSNSRYRCRYCDFEFVGGPQKIRVHLSGKKENGTRLSSCAKVPPEVRALMESRMVSANQRRKSATTADVVSGAEEGQRDDVSPRVEESEPLVPCLQPRNIEEQHCIVLSRSLNPSSKSSNSRYKCIYCRSDFVGGPQKIRVHLTGLPEGGTRVHKCSRAPRDVVLMMENRRRAAVKESVSNGVISAPTMVSHLATSGLVPANNNGLAHVRVHNLQQAYQLRTALVVAANAHAQALSAVTGAQMMNPNAMLGLPPNLYLMDQVVVQQPQ